MNKSAKRKAGELSVAGQILQGLREAIAFERGELPNVRVDEIPITARHVTAAEPPTFTASQIVDLRSGMGVSQAVFANALNVSPETVRAWEQGKNTPGGPALRLLEIAKEYPELVLHRIHHIKALDEKGRYRLVPAAPMLLMGSLHQQAGKQLKVATAKSTTSTHRATSTAHRKR